MISLSVIFLKILTFINIVLLPQLQNYFVHGSVYFQFKYKSQLLDEGIWSDKLAFQCHVVFKEALRTKLQDLLLKSRS